MEEINNDNLKQLELTSDVYRAIIDALSANAIFSVTDAKGDIVYANEKFVEISSIHSRNSLGRTTAF
ncbi:MAG: PAS domain-containing protein [Candidatus Pacebacteria bacterium]|jgi:PAS domain-containing protein|nr:PAS domain-containing protein [Candidatus Paceibacterota bacterium]